MPSQLMHLTATLAFTPTERTGTKYASKPPLTLLQLQAIMAEALRGTGVEVRELVLYPGSHPGTTPT